MSFRFIADVPGNNVPNRDFVSVDLSLIQLIAKILRCSVWVIEGNVASLNRFRPRRLKDEQVLCSFVPVVRVEVGYVAPGMLRANLVYEAYEWWFHDS